MFKPQICDEKSTLEVLSIYGDIPPIYGRQVEDCDFVGNQIGLFLRRVEKKGLNLSGVGSVAMACDQQETHSKESAKVLDDVQDDDLNDQKMNNKIFTNCLS